MDRPRTLPPWPPRLRRRPSKSISLTRAALLRFAHCARCSPQECSTLGAAHASAALYIWHCRLTFQGLLDPAAASAGAVAAVGAADDAAGDAAGVPAAAAAPSAVTAALLAAEEASVDPAARALLKGTFPRALPGAPDCLWLGSGGVVMVGSLTVACLSPGPAEAAGLAKLQQLCGKV